MFLQRIQDKNILICKQQHKVKGGSLARNGWHSCFFLFLSGKTTGELLPWMGCPTEQVFLYPLYTSRWRGPKTKSSPRMKCHSDPSFNPDCMNQSLTC